MVELQQREHTFFTYDNFPFVSDNECVYETDGLGRTALMYAVHFGHLDTVQTLLHNGIDVNATANGKVMQLR